MSTLKIDGSLGFPIVNATSFAFSSTILEISSSFMLVMSTMKLHFILLTPIWFYLLPTIF